MFAVLQAIFDTFVRRIGRLNYMRISVIIESDSVFPVQ